MTDNENDNQNKNKNQDLASIEKQALAHAWSNIFIAKQQGDIEGLAELLENFANTCGDKELNDFIRSRVEDKKKRIDVLYAPSLCYAQDSIGRSFKYFSVLKEWNQLTYESLIVLMRKKHYLDDLNRGYGGVDPNAESTSF